MARFLRPRWIRILSVSAVENSCRYSIPLGKIWSRLGSCECPPPKDSRDAKCPPPVSSPLEDPCSKTCPPHEQTLPPAPCPCPEPTDCGSNDQTSHVRLWRIITLLALPVILLMSSQVYLKQQEEMTEPRPEYIPYEYMYRRTKSFPWGDGNHTLFHNPRLNAVPPGGYEVEDPYASKQKDKSN